MTYRALDTVVLVTDLPEHDLVAGDMGAIVEVYDQEHLDVEFVDVSGHTWAVVTLRGDDVRPVGASDMPGARASGKRSAG